MKPRYWWYVYGLTALLTLVVLVNQRVVSIARNKQLTQSTLPATQLTHTLQTCNSEQSSQIGPLVPDQKTAIPDCKLSEIDPNVIIPKNTWSTRAGFSISSATDPMYWAQRLGSGWYIDWQIRNKASIDGLEHWSQIRVREDCISPSVEMIRSAASQFPGQVWIIGNEPDVIWQDNTSAERYAYTYHELYQTIKSSDPTALVAVGGISQATPLRLQYLDLVLQAYQNLFNEPMPVDWWTVHGYVLREEKESWGVDIPPGIDVSQGELREVSDHGKLDLFESQIVGFRKWMKERGYQGTPLALTEFGILMPAEYGFPTEMVSDYLEQSFTWLDNAKDDTSGYPGDRYHLVQKWAWFSISDPTYATSDLGDLPSGKLTLLGERFRNTITTMEP